MKKKLCIVFIITLFVLCSVFLIPHDTIYKVTDVISPNNILLGGKSVKIKNCDCFDDKFTDKNKALANAFNITEGEAFILGNLGKYWASNLLKGRYVYIKNNSDLVYLKYSYNDKLLYSGFCLKNSKPYFPDGFERKLDEIRSAEYKVLDINSENVYDVNDKNVRRLDNYIVVKKIHLPKRTVKIQTNSIEQNKDTIYDSGKIKVFYTDFSTNPKPDRNCNTSVCKEILNRINNSKETLDIAIYGYSRTPKLEEALISAQKRGVKIRLIYDINNKGENIYPDTNIITALIPDNKSDINSEEVKSIMHNKFYIFDRKVVITGSANLSHTDMSGFNSNITVMVESPEIAKIYTEEFENMFSGKFHNSKPSKPNKSVNVSGTEIQIFFSPQDKSIKNAILPLINEAKSYIYIPTFLITDKKITEALIKAKARGVDVKIIMDALNASAEHTKHKELRNAGILVKTENHAGKMHSKSIIIDDNYTVIGSMNFSYSGENKNDENLLVIKNPQITKMSKEFFMHQWNEIDDKWLKKNARAESPDSIGSCSDGLDNDYDGRTDLEDSACKK